MGASSLLILVLLLSGIGFFLGRARSRQFANDLGGVKHLHSLPSYYGSMVAYWSAIPGLLVIVLWLGFEDLIVRQLTLLSLPESAMPTTATEVELLLAQISNVASGMLNSADPLVLNAAEYMQRVEGIGRTWMTGMTVVLVILGLGLAVRRIRPELAARNESEFTFRAVLMACSLIAILTTLGIVLSVLFESLRFFSQVSLWEFITGTHWSPQTAIRADQVGASGSFGAVPLFVGTLQISLVAMCVAVPVGLMSAIYLAEYASPRLRGIAKPLLEVLAGIPTVVYGFFAALTVGPFIRDWGEQLGFATSSESALAAGLVMGIMIIPFVSSLSDDVINAVPQSLRDGSFGLGATQSETIRRVIIPAALPGIVGGILLAVSRAIGETMIVVMAAGLAANLTANPLESVTTVTVQIVTLLVGDQEFDSAKTLAAFALGLVLFIVTLILNIIALWVVNRYREQYE